MKHFQDEKIVREALASSATAAGAYVLPCPRNVDQNLSEEEKKAQMKEKYEQMQKGPFAFVVLSPKGTGPMWMNMIVSFVIQFVGAFLVTWILLLSRIGNYFVRLFFVIIFALAAGVICLLPTWNWWKFPADYTLIGIADLMAGWFLAGIFLAAIGKRSQTLIEPPENPLDS
jgi:hypothetical protein